MNSIWESIRILIKNNSEVRQKNEILRDIFSGRVGGGQAGDEAGEKEKETRMEDGRWKRNRSRLS